MEKEEEQGARRLKRGRGRLCVAVLRRETIKRNELANLKDLLDGAFDMQALHY